MFALSIRSALTGAILLAASPASSAERPSPSDPAVAVPAAEYRSAFTDYRQAGEPPVADWRRANDTVRETGGHAGALKGDRPAEAMPAGPAARPGGHAGHTH